MNMAETDRAKASVRPCAQQIVKRVLTKDKVSAFILDKNNSDKPGQIVKFFNIAFKKCWKNPPRRTGLIDAIIEKCKEHQLYLLNAPQKVSKQLSPRRSNESISPKISPRNFRCEPGF